MRQGWQRSNIDGMSGSYRMGKLRSLIALAAGMTVMTLPAEAFWGKYGSMREAEKACKAWLGEPERAQTIRKLDYARFFCHSEPETRQVMVIKVYVVEAEFFGDTERGTEKVVKRFRY